MMIVVMVTFRQVNDEKILTNYLIDNNIQVVRINEREILSRSEQSLYKESLNISKEYHDINFGRLFNGRLVCRKTGLLSEDNANLRRYFLVKDEVLGTFRIEDLGENYTVPRYIFKEKSQEVDFIEYLKEKGIRCKELNDNFLTIRKRKRRA